MTDSEPSPTKARDPSSEAFHAALADYLAHVEREDSAAIDAFRARHPEFASRLGKQLEWLAAHLARSKAGLPTTIGPYRVQQRLGSGGMGDVYLCEQTTPFRRSVAVKVIKLGGGEARTERFTSEIQTLASLNHDGVAKVFEAGNDHGLPWFSMEYVPGKPITDYCAEERLDLGARLRLFLDVCAAVEYAHRVGIIHRDLKPQNILVYGPATEPIAKVIDFGLAKVLGPDGTHNASTRSGAFVGTPDYMSPEQVDDAESRLVDTRADVYALGVVLYELLTGVLPLGLWQRKERDVQQLARAIREQQPSSPSSRVATSQSPDSTSPSVRGMSPKRLSRMLVGDLDSIVMKALAKDAERRYGSVAQFADDIRRHLRHEPVSARPATKGYVLCKFVGRHRNGVMFAATVSALLVASLGIIYGLAVDSLRLLEHGNRFGLAMYLQQLRARDAKPPAARPENLGALQQWLREFETVLAERDRLQAFVDASEPDLGASTDPSGWASGRYAQRVLRETLRDMLDLLAKMTAPDAELDQMRKRIDWSRCVEALTVNAHVEAWTRVRREVLDDWGFELAPQTGLVPLGRDQRTALQEFALPLPGGALPQRRDGRWVIEERTCPIFVLLPGGEAQLGSQADDANQPNFDPERRPFEDEPHRTVIQPFFASKFEFTAGQWQLLASYEADPDDPFVGATRPIVGENGASMVRIVMAWGMRLPAVDEWEYLARGGIGGPRWCGDASNLRVSENVHDAALVARPNTKGEGDTASWDDGFALTAPVGSLATPHPFLLHDVLGNASEIAVRTDERGSRLEIRGGSWHQGVEAARATKRTSWDGSPRPSIGFRPVISVQR